MKILVLGGTRFFGKRLVDLLIEEGHDVTIVTRGITADSFGKMVQRMKVDREDKIQLKQAIGDQKWDVVYDNICYSPQTALEACELFKGKVSHYIFTSSLSVYHSQKEKLTEQDFNPYTYPIEQGPKENFSYSEGKRLAEAVFYQQAEFPVSAVRFPIVLGTDDYTKRLHFHIDHVKEDLPIGVPNKDAVMSYIQSDEAAQFLQWLSKSRIEGPINACSNGELSLKEILTLIEREVGKTAIIQDETNKQNQSPFGAKENNVMANDKAKEAGFEFNDLHEWFPRLVGELAE
ncbi:NAD-dependent epimerase/dehydratase family protein [Bacillus carboniphilus]|uniref:NAD-dependent epimerase/dehydratase family protein n=1 Tax=Bacillus carboniphilus TaxID=86663 RepID=A0ABY9JY76_9BACI|nr:NAD-dependent epimerase/dehydratase family protein [Bacillus carboniphilus]WLR43395.1 NAD-dependent epimerase/dehydratase family protein [Bacillus carboniphilus]